MELNVVSAGSRPRTPLRDALSGVTVRGPTYLWGMRMNEHTLD